MPPISTPVGLETKSTMAGKSTPGIILALPSSTEDNPADSEVAGGTGEYKLLFTNIGCIIANCPTKVISEH
jgi:hypothetical protein